MRSSNTKGSATIPLIITIAILVLLSGFYFYSIWHVTPTTNGTPQNTQDNIFSPNNPNGSVYLQTPTQENYQPLTNYQTATTSSTVYKAAIQPTQSPISSPATIINNTPQTIAYSYSPFITSTASSVATTNYYAPDPVRPVVWPTQPTNTVTPVVTTKKKRGGGIGSQISSSGFDWTGLLIGIGTGGIYPLVNSFLGGSNPISSLGGSVTSGGGGNFGGQVTQTKQCTCGASTLLYIDDVSGSSLQLLYSPGQSTLYDHQNYQSGATVMGTYSSGGTCQVYKGEECESEGNPDGTINIIGTSQ
jgi:hypothetical protein